MQHLNYKINFILALFIGIAVILACGDKKDDSSEKEETKKEETKKEETKKETTSTGGRLYFCEDYIDGEEIGVSERFTPGWLTVMVKTDEPLGVGKVELRIVRIRKDGTEKIMDTVPFDVQADWDYTYFQDKKRIAFKSPGDYKVTLQKVDGSPIVSGEVTVVPR
jgi:hypothetical protein